MALTVGTLRMVLAALDDEMEVWVECLNSEDADGTLTPAEVVETYQEDNRVVIREDL